eukprot:CAMPEP_0118686006 /NCGR_PEP_ID=MMETSP0800-20121206/7571_1 /TAXON_ID=210618 ORGANISM="Striatella unipunctata, Strain CCMP2910" /NCGR_SAMPLE_ID=MMETSP0800 /ASSEMBLY_ACC=CAM_ASM_000638 /LENGTH=305 /DNA_ID=CAMNT_0006582999 /DNA_START=73 /DNA_END=990 /DNA_ORIENTATION=+
MAEYTAIESLRETEKLIIKQKVELMEAFAQAAANAIDMDGLGALGETANKYDVFTDDGGQKFKVIESSEFCGFDGCIPTGRCCCRPNHKLQLHVYAPEYETSQAIMFFDRPCKCGGCCSVCDICRQEMTVYTGASTGGEGGADPSKQMAYIKEPVLGGFFSPQLEVMERQDGGNQIATITANGVCCIGGICCDHTFMVLDAGGNEIGKIVKERPENLTQIATELGTDADNFTMYVPKHVDPQQKAAMLASLHLIDYMFFENEGDFNLDLINGVCQFKCCDLYCCGCVCPCHCSLGGGDGGEGGGE